MRNLIFAVITLAAATRAARAESLSPMSVPTDRTPTTAYAGLGVMVGGADGLIVAAANVEGGFHVGSALWLHALLATGSSSEFLGHGSGSFSQSRAGLELQGCTSREMLCVFGGADAGIQHATWSGTGLFEDSESRGAPAHTVVVPRVGVDTGGAARMRVAFDLAVDDEGVAGGNLTFGFAARW
jgi:hypothetical protein